MKTENNNNNLASTIYNTLGINIVTCGDCGAVNLHKAGLEEITCEYCNNTSDICDFPDLFDVSLPSSEIVNEMKKFKCNILINYINEFEKFKEFSKQSLQMW